MDIDYLSLIRIVSATLAPITAIAATIGGVIAYQQFRVNRDKFRLDLYEKRLHVYKALMSLLNTITVHSTVSLEEARTFISETHEATFLFGSDIPIYFDAVYKNTIQLKNNYDKLDDQKLQIGTERSILVNQNTELFLWFAEQYKTGAQEKFKKYLSFR